VVGSPDWERYHELCLEVGLQLEEYNLTVAPPPVHHHPMLEKDVQRLIQSTIARIN